MSARTSVLSISGGRSSMMMARLWQIEKGFNSTLLVFANTGKEHPRTLEFIHEAHLRWHMPIQWIEYISTAPGFRLVTFETASRNGEPFQELIEKRSYLPNVAIRMCTQELKVRPIKKYLKSIGLTEWDNVMGIRYDEPLRWGRLLQNSQREPWYNVLPLVEKKIIKADRDKFWAQQEFDLGLSDDEGNCDLCFLKGKAKLIRLIRNAPSKAEWWKAMEEHTGAQFRKRESYAALENVALSQQQLEFNDELEFPCHCNAD